MGCGIQRILLDFVSFDLFIVILTLFPCFVELASSSCRSEVSCPCGGTGSNYTFCLHNIPENEDVCRRWASCKECRPEVDHCTECPTGHVGPTCLQDCGRPFLEPDVKTAFGESTEAGEWPWTVAIAVTPGKWSIVVCGGVLIDTTTVLTSAHCVRQAESLELYFGKYYRRNEKDDEEVQKRTDLTIRVHPDFNKRTHENNIAVVKFSPPVQYSDRIQPACLPTLETTTKNLRRGKKGYVAGWGFNEKGVQSDALFSVHLPVLPAADCIKEFQEQKLDVSVGAHMFCAGYKEGGANVCAGDSGSPMVFLDRRRQRYTVEGLVSGGGQECGLPGHYTVFIKVLPYLYWIFDNEV